MFAMLNGRWPRTTDGAPTPSDTAPSDRPPSDPEPADVEALVAEVIRAQVEAGLDLVTDGQVRWVDPAAAVLGALDGDDTGEWGLLSRAWRSTAALTDRAATAQLVPGPYSLARRGSPGGHVAARRQRTLDLADALAGELATLARAGCPLVEVDEPAAIKIGADTAERELFATAQARLLAEAPDLHAMLLITGGSAWEAGPETILGAPYHSYLFDLIAGPDNWYLVRAAPGDRGIVCAALDASSPSDQAPILDFASRYAASANGRGPARVGIANATSLASFTPEAATEVLRTLARAARLAVLSPGEAVMEGLDPRTFPDRVIRATLPAEPPEGGSGEGEPAPADAEAEPPGEG